MEQESRIIAIRKRNIDLAHKAFAELMGKTEHILNDNAKCDPVTYRNLSASELEESSLYTIQEACRDTPFNKDEVKLISGQRFPDIIADKYYGIEVKSTKSDSWTSTGSSIWKVLVTGMWKVYTCCLVNSEVKFRSSCAGHMKKYYMTSR